MAHAPASDRPRQETTGPFMTIDQGSNQLHYMKPPYKAHVQLSLEHERGGGAEVPMKMTKVLGIPAVQHTEMAGVVNIQNGAPVTDGERVIRVL